MLGCNDMLLWGLGRPASAKLAADNALTVAILRHAEPATRKVRCWILANIPG